jgi:ring-1,2-phenylacetyl-CoA epoxidase subunit PaaC
VYRPLPGSGRDGEHTEHLAPLLAELQSVARAHPEAAW